VFSLKYINRMSYLTEAIHEIDYHKNSVGFYHIHETDTIDLRSGLDAEEYVERFYKKQYGYTGATNVVSSKVEDGYQVMLMESSL